MTNADHLGKSHAGNPLAWLGEGEVAPAATPRRGSLPYKAKNIVAAAVCCVSLVASGTSSSPVPVTRCPERSFLYRTAPSGEIALRWVKPHGAESATLTVTGSNYRRTYENLTGDTLRLSLPSSSSAADENVYELVLTFDDTSVLQATLGSIATVGSSSAVAYALDDSSRKWRRMERPAVLPIPFGVERFVVDGTEADTMPGGYAGCDYVRAADADIHTLRAETSTDVLEIELSEVGGMIFSIR